jgi:NTE family protein
MFLELQTMRRAIRRLEGKLPEDFNASLDWHVLSSLGCDAAITIVHLIHRRAVYSTQSNDYEFSRFTIDEHWRDGADDVHRTFGHPSWINRERPSTGVNVLDLTKELDPPQPEKRS